MSTNDNPFREINSRSKQSFSHQKQLLKRLFAGKTVPCDHCQQPLSLHLPKELVPGEFYGVKCKKGCTDLELEFEGL